MLEQVYREHRQGLYTLALAITRRPDRAEDAVQDAFARLWQSKNLPEDPVPYVFASVRNAAVDDVRRSVRSAALSPVSIYNGLPPSRRDASAAGGGSRPGAAAGHGPAGPEQSVIDAEQHRAIRDAVDALPQPEREAVVMKVYAGLTFDQIAQALGEPLPTVASRYRRALETLGQRIKGIVGVGHE